MILTTKRKQSPKHIINRLWNEFLFAREFEYETPLTPDEMAAALRAVQAKEHRSWVLSAVHLKHKVEFERHSDKAIDFKITVAEDEKARWSSKMSFIYTIGSITANADTGLAVVKGHTRFSGEYYVGIMMLFLANALTISGGMAWFWFSMLGLYWFTMYRERNRIADLMDDIIMYAKSERAISHLAASESNDDALDYEEVQFEQTASSTSSLL